MMKKIMFIIVEENTFIYIVSLFYLYNRLNWHILLICETQEEKLSMQIKCYLLLYDTFNLS